MFPILYDSITYGTIPKNFGLGVLKDAISCVVTEERNGSYELILKYPSSGAYANSLVPRAIIKAKPNFTDDDQLFRIYKVGKTINSSFTVYARHISYDLSGFPITSGTANNIGDAFELLQANSTGFTFSTDKTTHANFKITNPSSVRSWLGGKTGSILDVFGTGDYKYDNFEVKLLQNRGVDRGVTIRYGKNLTKLENTDDSSNLVTGVMAYWQSSDDNPITVISDTITTGVTLDVVAVNVIDASSAFENQPTKEQLNDFVNKYLENHEVKNIKKNFKFDFLQIKTQLKDRVDLCDTITIIYEDYNISATAKCISTKWDVLEEKYTEIEIGEPKTNIADTITSINKSISNSISENQVQNAINQATSLITGNKGGYVILHDSNNDGQPDELLVMNTQDISTATKVWRWNLSGLGYSSTGYDGTYGLAMTMDGAIVADYIKTGNLVFGGNGNKDGKLEIRDESGNLICRFDKTGADVKGNISAQSFTADAKNGVKVDIVKDTVSAGAMGEVHGAIGYYNNAPKVGFGFSGVDGVHQPTPGHFVKGDNNNSYAILRQFKDWTNATNLLGLDISYNDEDGDVFGYFRLGKMTRSGKVSHCGEVTLPGMNNLGTTNISPGFAYDGSTNNANIGYMSLRENGSDYRLSNISILSMSPMSGGNSTIYMNGNGGNIQCVSLTQTSSEKYKKNIEDLTEEEAKKILELRPVNYDFKDETQGNNMHGFIAEEVDKVIPSLVQHFEKPILDENGEQIDTTQEVALDYIMMIPYLTKMVQMQQEQINNLQKEIDKLKEGK